MIDANDWYSLPIPVLRFMAWNASPDLDQATWEWPSYENYASAESAFPSLKRPSNAFLRACERLVKDADQDWEQRGRKEFSRQIFHG